MCWNESNNYSKNSEVENLKGLLYKFKTIATAAAVAFVVISCKGKLAEADVLNIDEVPVQTVANMFIVQTENGKI